MKTPIIGIPLDREEKGEYSPFPYYILRENYFASLQAKGAMLLALPYQLDHASALLDMLDGLVIAGGAFDIAPSQYGDDTQHETVQTKIRRNAFETALTKGALERKLPLLGICGGEQLINVLLGGTLIQHIPDTVKHCLEHEQKIPHTTPTHSVEIVPGTLLHTIVGKTQIEVNSSHHQSVLTPAENVTVNCHAPDGVIEGIESADHPFCLGVQWHPEYEASPADSAILQAFLNAASQ